MANKIKYPNGAVPVTFTMDRLLKERLDLAEGNNSDLINRAIERELEKLEHEKKQQEEN